MWDGTPSDAALPKKQAEADENPPTAGWPAKRQAADAVADNGTGPSSKAPAAKRPCGRPRKAVAVEPLAPSARCDHHGGSQIAGKKSRCSGAHYRKPVDQQSCHDRGRDQSPESEPREALEERPSEERQRCG
ncbi:hypothetical protein MRX96_008879 [Rhipicephalus microplus]